MIYKHVMCKSALDLDLVCIGLAQCSPILLTHTHTHTHTHLTAYPLHFSLDTPQFRKSDFYVRKNISKLFIDTLFHIRLLGILHNGHLEQTRYNGTVSCLYWE